MSDSDSDSDSGDSDKEIIVRHVTARDPSLVANMSRVAEPKVKSAVGEVAAAADRSSKSQNTNQIQPTSESSSTKVLDTRVEDMPKAPSLTRTTSVDSNSSEVSVREEDIHILMRSIPEYKQYDDENGRSNDSYLRSALRSMPENLLDCKDDFGNTLLLIASQYSCGDLVKLLLKRGADPHIVNTSGACCLHFACYKDSLSVPIVELLLEQNVLVNVAETLYGCTPLHYAASTGEVELCRLLIQHGAYIHAHDFDNCSSVDYAVDAGMMQLADYLRAELHNTNTRNSASAAKSSIHSSTVLSPMRSKDTSPSSDRYGDNTHTTQPPTQANNATNAHTPSKHSAETPVKSAQRMIINTNASSLDEYDHTDGRLSAFSPPNTATNNNNNTAGPGSTSSYRAGHTKPPLPTPTQYNISSSGSGSGSAKDSPTNTKHTSANDGANGDYSRASPLNIGVTSSKSSPDSVHSSNYQADSSTAGLPSTTTTSSKRTHHQPISPSPYKPLPPSPSNTTHTYTYPATNTTHTTTHTTSSSAQGAFNANSGSSTSSSGSSDRVVVTRASPSVGGKGFFLTEDESHTNTHYTTNTSNNTNTTNTTTNNVPPLPSPAHMQLVEDSNYSNVDNITDLSPEKFELYIEQAKFNAKLSKERELHKSVLQQRDGKISSMQGEINSMKRTITNYKEEIHALSAKLDMLQLPFIEATNTLQDELQALKRENALLREQLRGSGGGSGMYGGKG